MGNGATLTIDRGRRTGTKVDAPVDALVDAPGECPLCKMYEGREYNAATLAAFAEGDRMLADPSLGKGYTDVDEMMAELLPNVHG